MKLDLNKGFHASKDYQKVAIINARGLTSYKSILDIELVDTETKENFTLGQLLESKDQELQDLKKDFETYKEDQKAKYDVIVRLIEALKNETREEGII